MNKKIISWQLLYQFSNLCLNRTDMVSLEFQAKRTQKNLSIIMKNKEAKFIKMKCNLGSLSE